MGTNVVVVLFIYLAIVNVVASPLKNESDSVIEQTKNASVDAFTYRTKQINSLNSIRAQECNLSEELKQEIHSHRSVVEQIIRAAVNGVYKGRTWRTLAKFVDTFGSRIAGSENLENSIDYMVDVLKKNKLDNVHTEPALVPKWVRGRESSWLVSPRLEKLAVLGLGGSVSTPRKGITAHAVVVTSFDELKQIGKKV